MIARGTVRVPGDKSISHRALILGTLATGESRIEGILESADIQSTASVLRSLGADIPELGPRFNIQGRGRRSLAQSADAVDAGNSGTTVRLMSGVVSAHPFMTRFIGDTSLSRRPMRRISEPLTAMGARFEFDHDDGLPMTIHGGTLNGLAWNTRAASGQTKSAILLAGLVCGVQVSVQESGKSRDHTERMLTSMGAPLETTELTVSLSPVDHLAPLEFSVPGDPSSAACFVALGILRDKGEITLPNVCMNRTRSGFIEVLQSIGADIEYIDRFANAGDTSATIVARPSGLTDTAIGGGQIPAMIDEIPLLACVAAASGISLEISGAGELRVKESDRIAAVVQNLRAIGADAEERADGLVIRGRKRRLAGSVNSFGDHRIAMAFGILGALEGNSIDIDDRNCVSISYPSFWSELAAVTY